ncbi:CPBP family intramembrane glutamic endopeptidase [Aeromicrobium wangtongii]|uniref:CPBP family intramembrane glutamic endopeptidase n=1 Tax=Aeromicrobium wangtongii TaxID=2969247 RepID=UPI002017B1C7|nr:CPBP family intramembrane glutamic endopeptidase [Aeromicrobium wangtongii]MCL3819431.1 CPBP family intramembrane metalloprotease [Aeromicrobium wangtongii]
MKFLVQLIAVLAIGFLSSLAVEAAAGEPWLQLAVGVVSAAVAVFAYRWVVRRTEPGAPEDLAGPGAVSALFRGTFVAVLTFAAVIGAIAAFGGYEIVGTGSVTGAAALVGIMATAAAVEELMFRGFLFRWIEKGTGTWIAFTFSALLFGLIHLTNPNATLWGAVSVAIGGGGMLTAAYLASRNLWLPIGLHFGWNVAGSALFSTEVSGNDTAQGLFDTVMDGPVLLTGGSFGPEASLFTLLFTGIVTVTLLVVARRRGNILSLETARDADRDKVSQ